MAQSHATDFHACIESSEPRMRLLERADPEQGLKDPSSLFGNTVSGDSGKASSWQGFLQVRPTGSGCLLEVIGGCKSGISERSEARLSADLRRGQGKEQARPISTPPCTLVTFLPLFIPLALTTRPKQTHLNQANTVPQLITHHHRQNGSLLLLQLLQRCLLRRQLLMQGLRREPPPFISSNSTRTQS